MSTAGRPATDAPPASDIAGTLRDAGFVRLVAAGTGDAVAAMGVLARALDTISVPYQLSVVPMPDATARDTDADVTIALGRTATSADVTLGVDERAATQSAHAVATELGDVALELTLAGIVAAGQYPDSDLLSVAESEGIERRPGVAVPAADVVDGLAHSTLVHTAFSGSVERVEAELGDTVASSPEDRRELASFVALTVSAETDAPTRAAHSVERFLRPLAGGPFETVGGHADVLDTVVRERPGLGAALAVGGLDEETALSTWRRHAARAHESVRAARTGRYDGLFVVKCDDDAPVGTVARLVRDYRTPETVVLAVSDGVAAATRTEDDAAHVGEALDAAATAVDGTGAGTATRARAQFDDDPTALVAAFREAL